MMEHRLPLESLEKCQSFVNLQIQAVKKPKAARLGLRPLVTLSRQPGAGAVALADLLAEALNSRRPKGAPPWTVFDKNLVEKVLADHELPAQIARFMPEDRTASIEDAVEELMGLHPSRWGLVQKATETILRLAQVGSVILVGRGANVITGHLPNAFHVRLVGSLERRVDHVKLALSLSDRQARSYIAKEEAARARYLKKYFKKEIDDVLLYHLVLNMDRIGMEEATLIIVAAVEQRARDLAASQEMAAAGS